MILSLMEEGNPVLKSFRIRKEVSEQEPLSLVEDTHV
jgi:hypothetical protein